MRSGRDGLFLIDKVRGVTSFDVIRELKKKGSIRKGGHTGTLDKFAEGLLLLLTGRFTRLVPLFNELDKTYRAVIHFGERTDTLDIYGKIVERRDIPTLEKIESCIKDFIGESEQVPPVFSSVHVNGKRAYKYALENKYPDIKARKINIYSFDVIDYKPPDLEVRLRVSKGTYVRAIARDLGRATGSCAYLKFLRREGVGKFEVIEAKKIEELDPFRDILTPYEFLSRIEGVEYLTVNDMEMKKLQRGMELKKIFSAQRLKEDKIYSVFNKKKELVAIFEKKNNNMTYIGVFN